MDIWGASPRKSKDQRRHVSGRIAPWYAAHEVKGHIYGAWPGNASKITRTDQEIRTLLIPLLSRKYAPALCVCAVHAV
jgi:hypothetical protein